ncbi:hypothetical protein [Desulfotomaculum nigrificans]|uniref:hypothetical protein n=1 Tax=Desulfotomaculum nigrificans TaxID=1565 RepID=UPI0001FAE9D4|nr:hypothetical protein [Desulfotomaculum nigrificans]
MVRFKYFSLFGFLLALLLAAGPLTGNVLAATDSGHTGHETGTVNQTGQNSGHDMGNMDMSGQNGGENMGNMDMTGMNSHDGSGNGGHGGHGENGRGANTPPNWPLIYGFLGFNILVITAAALMKKRGAQGNGVN